MLSWLEAGELKLYYTQFSLKTNFMQWVMNGIRIKIININLKIHTALNVSQ